jgi:sulfate adenylyltransferase subunit 1 (EFTu-like GTPase family)
MAVGVALRAQRVTGASTRLLTVPSVHSGKSALIARLLRWRLSIDGGACAG